MKLNETNERRQRWKGPARMQWREGNHRRRVPEWAVMNVMNAKRIKVPEGGKGAIHFNQSGFIQLKEWTDLMKLNADWLGQLQYIQLIEWNQLKLIEIDWIH